MSVVKPLAARDEPLGSGGRECTLIRGDGTWPCPPAP